ncbi:hypothetical protein BC832DRAFT_452677 [Gaertneriomyces semiglobifer]|nr:hypothetical protein BC832DRAFT_452677 [Gaertneriomyces semiglobifer]
MSHELSNIHSWENRWGFMKDIYKKDGASEQGYVKLPPLAPAAPRKSISGLPSKLPPGLTADPDSYISDLLSAHMVSRIVRTLPPRKKYTYPATTLQEYGWNWEREDEEKTALEFEKQNHADKLDRVNPDRPIRREERERLRDKEKAEYIDAMQQKLQEDSHPVKARFRTLETFGRFARGQGDISQWWGPVRK